MKIRALLVGWIVSVAVVFGAEAAAKKHPITHEELWLMKRVGAPVPSPDGQWVVFSVAEPAYDAKDQSVDLWLKSLADDTPARRITSTKAPEGGVSWSPDSASIVFTTRREGDEASQIYLLNLKQPGEAERLTSLTMGARSPKFSPDGKQLLFVSDVFPGANDEDAIKKAAKERKDRKYNARAYEQFPPRFWMSWLDDKKAHLFVMDAKAGAKARDLLAGSKLAELPGFGGGQGDDGQNLEAEWAPDSSGVVFSVSTNRDAAAREPVYTQLYFVTAAGGEPKRLTNDKSSYGNLQFSPDGKTLFCITDPNTIDKVYDLSRLASFPWPFDAAKKNVLTAKLDRAVGRYALPEGSDRVYFTF